MRKPFVLVGLLLLVTGLALAQEPYPKIETSPAFMFIRTSPNFTRAFVITNPVTGLPFVTGQNDFNCAGGGGTITFNVNRFLGFGPDLGACKFFGNTLGLGNTINGYQATFLFGPRIAFRNSSRVTPFFDLQFGADRLSASCKNSSGTCVTLAGTGTYSKTAFALTTGGGLDIAVNRKLSIRLIQAEYLYTRFGNDCALAACSNNNNQNSFRLKSGIVLKMGGGPPPAPPTASCSAQPSGVMVGEPVTVTATGGGFNPKHELTYSWKSDGGKVSGTGTTATIDTNGVAGGNYTATATITDPKEKKNNTASCTAALTVKEPPKNPPTMSCSASPSSVQPGGSSTITCTCTSPDGVPVSVGDWSASSGTLSGSGNTATLSTSAPGSVTVSATCTDARGLKSSVTNAQVMVSNPPPPPVPQASKLSQCDFPNPVKPWRVDNTCKAILDDVGKNLQQTTDNKLVIVGNSEPTEKRKNLAAERAVDSKAYLTSGEAKLGIDPSRIETRTGVAGTKTAEYWIVPAGGTFSGEGTQAVDESQVKPVPDHPAAHKAAAKKPAAQ